MENMQKLIDKVISENLELIESNRLTEFVLDNNTTLTFKSTSKGIRTTLKNPVLQ